MKSQRGDGFLTRYKFRCSALDLRILCKDKRHYSATYIEVGEGGVKACNVVGGSKIFQLLIWHFAVIRETCKNFMRSHLNRVKYDTYIIKRQLGTKLQYENGDQ